MKRLKEMISDKAYQEIKEKVTKAVGLEASNYIFPAVREALEHGSGKCRESILSEWLDCDHVRVCSICGALMQKGWYLYNGGYACSDKCAAKSEGLTEEEFRKYGLYKDDIVNYLKSRKDTRSIEELSAEECDEIVDEIFEEIDYYYTEWD